jgi:hypothetical protein
MQTFLTSGLDGGGLSASRPSRFTPRERASGTHWIGDWMSPRAGMEVVPKRINLPYPCREPHPGRPARYQGNILTELARIHGFYELVKFNQRRQSTFEQIAILCFKLHEEYLHSEVATSPTCT